MRTDLQGNGYATEAATACRDHARYDCGVHRLIAIIDSANVPSQRVAEKIGLGYERDAEYGGAPSGSTPPISRSLTPGIAERDHVRHDRG